MNIQEGQGQAKGGEVLSVLDDQRCGCWAWAWASCGQGQRSARAGHEGRGGNDHYAQIRRASERARWTQSKGDRRAEGASAFPRKEPDASGGGLPSGFHRVRARVPWGIEMCACAVMCDEVDVRTTTACEPNLGARKARMTREVSTDGQTDVGSSGDTRARTQATRHCNCSALHALHHCTHSGITFFLACPHCSLK